MKPLNIEQNVPLGQFSTMGLGGMAAYVTTVSDGDEVAAACAWAAERNLRLRMIGLGSNIIWRDEGFDGLLVVNAIQGFASQEVSNDPSKVDIALGAGENWDSIVARTVEMGLTGIEALSLVPGTSGATPVQNVGAYGQDISQTLVSVQAYDTKTDTFVTIPASDCGFGYRTSRFKSYDNGRFMITHIKLRLTKGNPAAPYYPGVQQYFEEQGIDTTSVTPQVLRDAVIAIRSAKLPDPLKVANNGSFFANPIITDAKFSQIHAAFPAIPHWPADEGTVKLSAAWLIEQTGFKDYHDDETGMATWPAQPLVLVNEHARSTADLLRFKQTIVEAVAEKFFITLEQEPELLP